METTEIRQILEREFLKLNVRKSPLSESDFFRYCACLSTLHRLECRRALGQSRICTAAHGSLGNFVLEFSKYVLPVLNRMGKNIEITGVRQPRTNITFSPRLIEIALGCMINIFLTKSDNMHICICNTKSGVTVRAMGKSMHNIQSELIYLSHITRLHSGKIICSIGNEHNEIALTLSILSQITPIKAIPCSAELCRLCRI